MNPHPFSDEDLALLLRAAPVQDTSSDLADRIAAAAVMVPQDSGPSKLRWPRRLIPRGTARWVGAVGINMIAVAAAATSWTGHGFDVHRIGELPARIVAVFNQPTKRTPRIARDVHPAARPPHVQIRSSAAPAVLQSVPVVSPALPNPASRYLVELPRRDVITISPEHVQARPAPVWHGTTKGVGRLHGPYPQAKKPRYKVRVPAKPAGRYMATAPDIRMAAHLSEPDVRALAPTSPDKGGLRTGRDSIGQRPPLTSEERAARQQQRRDRWVQNDSASRRNDPPTEARLEERRWRARNAESDSGMRSPTTRPDAHNGARAAKGRGHNHGRFDGSRRRPGRRWV